MKQEAQTDAEADINWLGSESAQYTNLKIAAVLSVQITIPEMFEQFLFARRFLWLFLGFCILLIFFEGRLFLFNRLANRSSLPG
jgi:hypothetical protein